MAAYNEAKAGKRTSWAAMAFYFLITFEFFYMASPFAIYFYAVYQPGIKLMEYLPGGVWLMSFFLPHLVLETTSPLINLHNYIGAGLASLGLLGFMAAAVQIYYAKIKRKGEVTGFLYRRIRHPQYLFLAVAGLGFLLLWPRYLVLIMYLTMLFVYYLLAKYEEAECLAKFGESYESYLQKTHMFLPVKLPWQKSQADKPVPIRKKALKIALIYGVVMAAGLTLAINMQHMTVHSLYSYVSGNAVYISIAKIGTADLQNIVKTVLADKEVQKRLANIPQDKGLRLVNYVAPRDWFASEIPMNQEGADEGSHFGENFDLSQLKIIFTKAGFSKSPAPNGLDILTQAVPLIPLFEVWYQRQAGLIKRICDLPPRPAYDGIPMPLF